VSDEKRPQTLFGFPIVYSDREPVIKGTITIGYWTRCPICNFSLAVASRDTIKCRYCGSIMPTPKRMEQTAEDAEYDTSEWVNSR
jgi:hypothetical protein